MKLDNDRSSRDETRVLGGSRSMEVCASLDKLVIFEGKLHWVPVQGKACEACLEVYGKAWGTIRAVGGNIYWMIGRIQMR